ncbi:MAG: prolipoprotein diacylglyceryl transferase [Anaerolineaceae bacterium]|nr:prolipoprotein diacylglyceryl transferase [Anaerolineaceae bacterium]
MDWFALAVGFGSTLGCWQIAQKAPIGQSWRLVNGAIFTLLGCLIGARLAYAGFHSAYFSSHPLEVLELWLGGLSWPGAVVGAVFTVLILAGIWHMPVMKLADGLAPLFPPLAIGIWLGCWQAGIAYGASAPSSSWWGMPALDETGTFSLREPLQLLAALSILLFFVYLESSTRLFKRPGQLIGITALGISINLLVFSRFRADPVPLWNGIRTDILAGSLFVLISLFLCILAFIPHQLKR